MAENKMNKHLYDKRAAQIKKDLENKLEGPHLREVSKLSDFNDADILGFLKAYYDSDDSIYNRVAVVLNSIITHGNVVFILTQKYVEELLAKDEAISVKAINGKIYKEIMKVLYNSKIIACLRKPIRTSIGIKGMSGLYEVIDQDLLGIMIKSIGANTLLAQREEYIKWFDVNNPGHPNAEPVQTEVSEYTKQMRQIAADKIRIRDGK